MDAVQAAETFGEHILGAGVDHLLELSTRDRERVFNLGYYTWVEQQGIAIDEFVARRGRRSGGACAALLQVWDELIDEFNARSTAQAS